MLIQNLSLQQIMKDRWINAGHEDDELKPFVEPELDISDQKRIGKHQTGITGMYILIVEMV